MKPAAYMTVNGTLFKEAPPAPMELTPLYCLKNVTNDKILELYEKYIETQYLNESNIVGFVKAIIEEYTND